MMENYSSFVQTLLNPSLSFLSASLQNFFALQDKNDAFSKKKRKNWCFFFKTCCEHFQWVKWGEGKEGGMEGGNVLTQEFFLKKKILSYFCWIWVCSFFTSRILQLQSKWENSNYKKTKFKFWLLSFTAT